MVQLKRKVTLRTKENSEVSAPKVEGTAPKSPGAAPQPSSGGGKWWAPWSWPCWPQEVCISCANVATIARRVWRLPDRTTVLSSTARRQLRRPPAERRLRAKAPAKLPPQPTETPKPPPPRRAKHRVPRPVARPTPPHLRRPRLLPHRALPLPHRVLPHQRRPRLLPHRAFPHQRRARPPLRRPRPPRPHRRPRAVWNKPPAK